MTKNQTTTTVEEYKGKPLLVIGKAAGEKFPFRFGAYKAGLILRHFAEIKAFHEKFGAKAAA